MLFLFPTWSGDPADGEPFIDALSRLGTPVVTQVGAVAYEEALGLFDPVVVNGRHYASRTRWLADLTPDSTAVLAEAGSSLTSVFSAIAVHHFHGAASRVPTQATAFGLRREHFLVEMLSAWEPNDGDDGSAHRRWSQELFERLASYALPGGYPNLLGPDEAGRLADAYGPNAPRLRELKRRYDPHGVFSAAIGTLRP